MKFSFARFFLAACSLATIPLWAEDDAVVRAMRDELARSVMQLQLENLGKPYFVSYRVQERLAQQVSAQFGSTTGRSTTRYRALQVEVRVGSPALDNTNFLSGDPFSMFSSGSGVPVELSLDDNYTELRRQIWLATDRAYKAAVENFSKKKAALENKNRTDLTADFTTEEPVTLTDLHPLKAFDFSTAEALARELSAIFRSTPAVATSNVSISADDELTRYVNSEGTSFTKDVGLISLDAIATTQAADGLTLDDHYVVFRHNWDEIPPKAKLLSAVRELGAHLTSLRDGELLEQYNGPVLFENQAAAEVFEQVFAPRLAAKKRPVSENDAMAGAENPFVDKLGARVLPDFLSVTDDPLLTTLANAPLLGNARIDDEGVTTRPVKLVENGRLKTLLVGRSPIRGIPKSTGSTQGYGPSPSNLIVTAKEGLDLAELKAELIKTIQQRGKDYGVIIRRLGNPLIHGPRDQVSAVSRDGVRVEPATLAYKLFPDGHEVLLRNVEIAGMNPAAFKDILVAGRDPFVISVPFRSVVSPSPQLVSFAVPSLLFDDVTLKKPSGEIPKLQIVKHPFFDK